MTKCLVRQIRQEFRVPEHVKRHRARLALIKQVDAVVKYMKARSLAMRPAIDDGD